MDWTTPEGASGPFDARGEHPALSRSASTRPTPRALAALLLLLPVLLLLPGALAPSASGTAAVALPPHRASALSLPSVTLASPMGPPIQVRTNTPATSSSPALTPPSPLPLAGWDTPRGPASQNGSSTGLAPEFPLPSGPPATMASKVLGPSAANLTGIAVAPGGPVVVALRNGSILAFGEDTLLPLWNASVREPLVAGPSVIGGDVGGVISGEVYAAGLSGRVYAWDLATGQALWNLPLGSPDLGAAPLPYGGNLYVLTQQYLSILNATNGALELQTQNYSADPTHAPAEGAGELYAQAVGGVDTLTPFGGLAGLTPDTVSSRGATLWADGRFSVAASDGVLTSGVPGNPTLWAQSSGAQTLLPPAASNGRVFATDGVGPLYAWNLSLGALLWKTTFYATGPPTVVGDQVFLGANITGSGAGIADLNASSGQLLWFEPLPKAVNSSLAIADGVLYTMDQSGNLTALGSPPLGAIAISNRTEAQVGGPFDFTTSPSGGAPGVTYSVSWTFSDGTTGSGTSVVHAFPAQGPAWAVATVTDSEGSVAVSAPVTVSVLPLLSANFRVGPLSGTAPLLVGANATVSGGSGTIVSMALEVQGMEPGWYQLSSPSLSLVLSRSGKDNLTLWVNDSAGDVFRSTPREVTVLPAAFPPPAVSLLAPSPGTVEAYWTASPGPGFIAWTVALSIDGGTFQGETPLGLAANVTSYQVTGTSMNSLVEVAVTEVTAYGNFTGVASITTPLVAPTLGASPSGLPGQVLLAWTLGAPIDHFGNWWVNETLPGATSTTSLNLSSLHTYAPSFSGPYNLTAPPVPALATTSYVLTVATTDGSRVSSPSIDFTPLYSPPLLQATGGALTIHVAWNDLTVAQSLPDFQEVRICFASSSGALPMGPWSCPRTFTSQVGSVDLSVPSATSYEVNATVVASNGFAVPSATATVQVLPAATATVWYATPLAGAPFWSWLLWVLTLIGLLLVGTKLLRERRSIPPYSNEVLPWDPEGSDLEPRARPKDPDTLLVTKIHRHRASHTHRHALPEGTRTKGGADEVDQEEEEEEDEVRPKRSSEPGKGPSAGHASGPRAERGSSRSGEEDLEEGRTGTRSADRPVRLDTVGESSDVVEGPDHESALERMPVVLRHRDPKGGEESDGAPERPSPATRTSLLRRPRPSPSRPGEGQDDDEDEEEERGTRSKGPEPATPSRATLPPRRPAPSRPKPEDDEPTL